MSEFGSTEISVQTQSSRKTVGSRLADLGDRVARALAVHETGVREAHPPRQRGNLRPDPGPAHQAPGDAPEDDTVEEYFRERERELAELQARAPRHPDIDAELARIGRETSTILLAAHDEAQEMIRRAQAQADHCVAEAASRAMTITEQADRRVRELDSEAEALWRERLAMLEDVQSLGAALSALAGRSMARFPSEAAAVPVSPAAAAAGVEESAVPSPDQTAARP